MVDLRTGARVAAPSVEVHVRISADESCRVWVVACDGHAGALATPAGGRLAVWSMARGDANGAHRWAMATADTCARDGGFSARVYTNGHEVWRTD